MCASVCICVYLCSSVCLYGLCELQQDKKTENSHLSNCLETPHLASVIASLTPPRVIKESLISAGKYQTPVWAFVQHPKLKLFHSNFLTRNSPLSSCRDLLHSSLEILLCFPFRPLLHSQLVSRDFSRLGGFRGIYFFLMSF